MERLLKARERLLLNSKKGFTLVELIVVIVILAILIAALTPAILGVINRANVSADQADVRSVMMAGSVAGSLKTPPGVPDEDEIKAEIIGAANIQDGTYTIFFDGPIAVGGSLPQGSARGNEDAVVGDILGGGTPVTVTFP